MLTGNTIRRIPVFFAVFLGLTTVGCTTANQSDLGVGNTTITATQPAENAPADGSNATTAMVDPNAPVADPTLAATSPVSNEPPKPARPVIANVRFLPVTGAPSGSVRQLAGSLSSRARAADIGIASSAATSINYQIKGYMSALTTKSGTAVTFYWDVLGPSGNRLYRINGFEKVKGTSSDPWKRVDGATLDRIASRTIDSLSSWIKRRKG